MPENPVSLQELEAGISLGQRPGQESSLRHLAGTTFGEELELLLCDGALPDGSEDISWKQQSCVQWSEVETAIDHKPDPDIRIFSVHSRGSVQPLKIRHWMMQSIMNRYQVSQHFLDVLESIGDAPEASRCGNDGTFAKSTDGRSGVALHHDPITCSYRLLYPERNNRSPHSPFSMRHTAVYHQWSSRCSGDQSRGRRSHLFIILHPTWDTPIERALKSLVDLPQVEFAVRFGSDPAALHGLIYNTYMGGWRQYLHHLNEVFTERNDEIETTDLESAALKEGLKPAQDLRQLYDNAITAQIFCNANAPVAQALADLLLNIGEVKAEKRRYEIGPRHLLDIQQCQTGFAALQDRVRSANELLEYAVSYRSQEMSSRFQQTAAKLNDTLLGLTRNTVDDSATIRIITVFSLIFLPGTFIATLYGMNFFVFDPHSLKLSLGSNFWVFVATWLPLTALILCIYIAILAGRKRLKISKTTI